MQTDAMKNEAAPLESARGGRTLAGGLVEKMLEQILDVLKDIARLQALNTLEKSDVPWNAVIVALLALMLWRIW